MSSKEYHHQYWLTHKEETQRRSRASRLKLRLLVLTHYSKGKPKCACCDIGYLEFLTIDHIAGGGHKHVTSLGGASYLYGWLKKNNFPQGFQVLCYNCNCSKGRYGYCPHTRKEANVTRREKFQRPD